ncbi:MAG: hypothetical protein IJW50_01190 [Clostridia bacterium]|nr:hypothetical protein [Clostridia bacterium]
MKNIAAKKVIASYYILSLLLTLPLSIPIWLIKNPLGVILYFLCFLIYMRIAIYFAVRITIMSSLWKELDAEKYAAIINAKFFLANYSYKLNLDFATGNYQNAHNIINSVLLQHKNVNQKVYGHLLLCRVCFERGDYEGIKDNLAQIDNYHKYNPTLKLSKPNKAAYEFYCAFSNADYTSACAIAEKGIDKYSKKKNLNYLVLMRQYQLAVTKRMKGDIDEAVELFESIMEKAPKLILSTLAQKQLDYISGVLEETAPERLEVTENHIVKSNRKIKISVRIAYCVGILLILVGIILTQLDSPKQKDKDLNYIAQIEKTIEDEYEEYQVLGYFYIYSDYADETYMMSIDSLFLVEADGKLDLHTLYQLNGEYKNILDVKDIQVDTLYEYEIYFIPKKVEFIITEKERNIPKDTLYYYEIDGYYFCVISISD